MRLEYEFTSFGEVAVKGYKWIKDTEPNYLLIISHGMAEVIDRYEEFAEFLLENNIFVYGHSHRGHGKTALSVNELGYIGENGWMKMKEDLRAVVEMAKYEYPDVPTVLLGHSMGSFLARDFILDYSYMLDGIILSGTGFLSKLELYFARRFSGLELARLGPYKPSKKLNDLSFGKYNKKIKNPNTEFDWLSRDKGIVEKYIESEYCGAIHPASFYDELSSNLYRIFYTDIFKNIKENLPMLVFSGDQDPVGKYGRAVKKTASYYKAQGFLVTLKLYSGGRHEMLNEINRYEVYSDILAWIYKLKK